MVLGYMATAHWLGYEATAITAVISAVLATYTTTILQLLVLTNDLDTIYPQGARRRPKFALDQIALPVLLVESFFFLLTNADVHDGRHLSCGRRCRRLFRNRENAGAGAFRLLRGQGWAAPQFAALRDWKTARRCARFARRSANWTFFPSLAMALAVLGRQLLLSMFGASSCEGYPLLFILVIGVVLRSGVGPAESLLNMTGHQNICAVIFGRRWPSTSRSISC
jgi:O-antigen/teichoic acid export membrane protein